MKTKSLKSFLFILFLSSIIGTSYSQGIKISGVVKNVNTHKEISNVNIYMKGQQVGTTTDVVGKFSLFVREAGREAIIVFQHIAYEPLEVTIESLLNQRNVYLQPRVIPLKGVTIEEEGIQQLEIKKDLPQTVSVVQAEDFEIRGYVDAGDLLRTDHSVQVEEELSGKKTASIRGGNPDEVVVMYNDIKMNSAYDNIFDLSLIDLEDIERFEIIKGSNTALYGPEAFSGVINIVPKVQQDYNIRFQQRLGTYRSGNWGLHLYQRLGALSGSYSIKRGGMKRSFIDTQEQEDQGLENKSTHHTANLNIVFSEHPDGRPSNLLSAMGVSTELDYDNFRDNEFLRNRYRLASLKFTRESGVFKNFDISVSGRELDETQSLFIPDGNLDRTIDDRALYLDVEKRFKFGLFELLTSYQMQYADLDFTDKSTSSRLQKVGLESAKLSRMHHGFVSILKIKNETMSDFLQSFDMDLSLRHDRVIDDQNNPVLRDKETGETVENEVGIFGNNKWNETVFKFSIGLNGYRDYLSFDGYLNFGTNVKFPTLFQQISSPLTITTKPSEPNLNPEKSKSLEIGFNLTKEFRGRPAIYGWGISGNFFQNHYDNKFRMSTTPGVPINFYDNVPDARISGVETKSNLYLYKKKVTLQYALSKYFISEKAAFPFKSDFKHTFDFLVDHAGYAFQLHWFHESEQVGWLRLTSSSNAQQPPNSRFGEIALPSYSNLDVHLSKKFAIYKFKLFINFSGRNLLNGEDVLLEGLAIRDRRFYLTLGAQY